MRLRAELRLRSIDVLLNQCYTAWQETRKSRFFNKELINSAWLFISFIWLYSDLTCNASSFWSLSYNNLNNYFCFWSMVRFYCSSSSISVRIFFSSCAQFFYLSSNSIFVLVSRSLYFYISFSWSSWLVFWMISFFFLNSSRRSDVDGWGGQWPVPLLSVSPWS